MAREHFDPDTTTKVLGIKAGQEWGDTNWSSWLRYYSADYGMDFHDKVNQYGIGIAYQYNPAVKFELAYDYIDFGNQCLDVAGDPIEVGNDHVIRFGTFISF